MIEKNPAMGQREIPRTVLDYLRTTNETIRNNYRTPNGQYPEHCGLIALDIAKLFLESGRRPHIEKVAEDVEENGFIHSRKLSPIIYQGRVSWGAHLVCCCDGQALDPILGNPINVEDYARAVFGEEVRMVDWVAEDKIDELVNRV